MKKNKKAIKKSKKNNNRILNWLKKYRIGIALILLVFFASGFVYVIKNIPNPRKLITDEYPESSQIFDRNGEILYEFYSDKRRVSVKLNEVPDNLKKATIAIEDTNFYNHLGFDIKGILRGLYRTIIQKRLQGGSTLTQQLVKNALLTPERTLSRKIKEAILTVATEVLYTKDQILEMYFNQTPYGGTLWGVQAASQGIFNKKVSELSLAEAALLAGLPGSPTKYSPFAHPELAKMRQEMVLSRMLELNYIDQKQFEQAKSENLNYYVNRNTIKAPHFVFYVKELLVEKYGSKTVNEGGLKIKTSLDSNLQNFVESAIATEVGKLNRYNVTNGAALVTEPKSGQILAMAGSKDYFADDIDGKYNVTTALRQPGSSIKPLNYAIGLETGAITAASVVDDSPTCFKVENQKPYCPTNYGNHYYGIQNIRHALANSLNIPAVKVLKLNGVENFIASASAMGISTFKDPANYGLSLTLGGGEVMMTDMAVAYGVLANMGTRINLTPIISITDRHGKTIYEDQTITGERVLSRETAFIIQQILSDDGARSMVFGGGSLLKIKNHPEVAVKTGTTNELKDNWTIGYTPDYIVATWVGNNNNTKMSGVVSGTSGAAPIWNKVMNHLLQEKTVKKPSVPANIVGMNVCNLTGELVPDGGCEQHFEYFKKEFTPKEKRISRMNVLINKDTGRMVSENENAPNTEWQEHTVIKDISGVNICVDCPLVNMNPDPNPDQSEPVRQTVVIN